MSHEPRDATEANWARLRRAFAAAGYDEAAVAETLQLAPISEAVPPAIRHHDRSDATVLMRLFLLGESVSSKHLPIPVEALEEAGLVEREGASVRARVRLVPEEEMVLASDPDERCKERDYVVGVQNSSRTLATLTIREPVERALDVGTGCGLQALLAAQHAHEVVATDINPRALRYAELNARLNGITLATRAGSWFEPVGGDLFDLIVANPPYVISPENHQLFRDSELGGEGVSRAVVRGATRHLREGGYATVLVNWACREEAEPWEPLREWVEGSGCDALLLANEPIAAFEYAARWNEPLRSDADAYERTLERWLEYFEHEGAPAIGLGAVVLRRREGDTWCRGFRLADTPTGAAGGHLLRLFAAEDEPAPDQDDELSAMRFRLVAGHRLDQSLVYRERYELGHVTMSLEDGIGLTAEIDADALPLLFALDAEREVGDIAREAELEPATVMPSIRRLYERGFLERG